MPNGRRTAVTAGAPARSKSKETGNHMADKMADLSPEEKEKRIAEMKAKMQASAQKAKAASGEAKPAAPAKPAAEPAGASAAAPAAAPAAAGPVVGIVDAPPPPEDLAQVKTEPAPAKTNGAAGAAGTNGGNGVVSGGFEVSGAPVLVAPPPPIIEETPEQRAKKQMNRREFLTYAFGATVGLLALEAVAGIYFFMYPRFKAGEFGGKFFIGPESSLPQPDAAPVPYTAGKFWLVTTQEEGPKALYMVCTHLGCLYKWAQSNNRFECPCHGSKFSHDGFYIEGPAPRSLDHFLVAVEGGQVSVDTGKKTLGLPSAQSPARAVKA